MSYDLFLMVLSQLAGKQKASIAIEDQILSVEVSKDRKIWIFSMTVFFGEGEIPQGVFACVSSRGTLNWQKGGAHLRLDPATHSVLLVEEVEMLEGKYLSFRRHLNDFLKVSAEWRAILQDLSNEEYQPLYKSP